MLKTLFMGTPEIAAEILRDFVNKYGPPLCVITQPEKPRGRGHKSKPTPVEVTARELGLPVHAIANVNEESVLEKISAFKPDLLLVVAFGQILKEELLALPSLGALNVHASLLPKYRGAAPIQRAIWNGNRETGITIQKIVRKLDAGDIVVQEALNILPNETSGELFKRLTPLGGKLLVEAVKLFEKGKVKTIPQKESDVTFAKKIEKIEGVLDFKKTAQEIHNQVRALNPWPIAETKLEGKRVKIYRVEATSHSGKPGEIETDHKTYLRVFCAKGALNLLEVQLENRNRMPIGEYLRGSSKR